MPILLGGLLAVYAIYGGVAWLWLERFKEQDARYEYLENQRRDLANSDKRL